MLVLSVVGARPQFVKAAVVSSAISDRGDVDECLIHTGQHYDADMSAVFFDELGIPKPTVQLGVGSGDHGAQTAAMLEGIERELISRRPDIVLVYGDTNSTIAAALAAAKLQIPIAHVEAGLRSFNRAMPEEINRVVTDHLSQLLFAPTLTAERNLGREGIESGVHVVGDVMYDAAKRFGGRARSLSRLIQDLELVEGKFLLATVHRAENTDHESRLGAIVQALNNLAEDYTVVLPLHPRTNEAIQRSGLQLHSKILKLAPLGYIDMTRLEMAAAVIVTDSGGVQKEAFFHRTPCVTLREETEWVELIDSGWNVLASPDDSESIESSVRAAVGVVGAEIEPYGTGVASGTIVELLCAFSS